jgi:aldehyde:ferredoxin oxidoreductase
MPNGYHGRILHVNLTTGSLDVELPDESFYRLYFGGSALALHYLLHNMDPGIEPFDPENILVFALSVLTGAPISGQSRLTTVAKSPLSGAIGDSQSGGIFPAEMKFSGFDGVVIHGRSEEPVYLWLHDGQAELRSAQHLWGLVTGEAEAAIREELGDPRIQVAQCGPAGENLVRFAAIINMSSRANGRTGLGAVMGSKNLKAVAVRGNDKPPLANRKALVDLARWGAAHFADSDVYGLGTYGTAELTHPNSKSGGLPTRNWDSGTFEHAESLDGTTMYKTILKERNTCYACTVRCKRVVEVMDGAYPIDPLYGGPEYEALATLGSYCCVGNLEAVAYANQLCNMYGMDAISCGATIAWAMDCFENGLITEEDTDGLDLHFGNSDAMVKMVEKIAIRDGLGDLLAEGSARAASAIGRGTDDLVVTVKKQELPAHMPQVKRGMGLMYAITPFGADHISAEHDPSYQSYAEKFAKIGLTDPQSPDVINLEKVRYLYRTQQSRSCMDTLNLCKFVFGPAWQLYDLDQLAQAVRSITGWEVTVDELLQAGERRVNMLRAFNAREGLTREDDTLPKKLGKPLVGGKSDGKFITAEEIEQAKDMYYEMAGWDITTGNPTRAKLEELDIGWVADLLYP